MFRSTAAGTGAERHAGHGHIAPGGPAPPPGAEAAWLGSGSGVVSVFRVRLAAGALGGSYSIRLAYIGGDNCQVPVELQSFEVG